MPRRIVLFVVIAFAAAALFVRLGIWQLHRLGERRALNALVASRLDSPAVDATRFSSDTLGARELPTTNTRWWSPCAPITDRRG